MPSGANVLLGCSARPRHQSADFIGSYGVFRQKMSSGANKRVRELASGYSHEVRIPALGDPLASASG